MRGTGSHDISVTDVFVPKARTFPMQPEYEPGSHYKGPLYRMPLVGYAGTGIPTPMLGVARRALDEAKEVAMTKNPVTASGLLKERSSAQIQLGRAEAILGVQVAYFFSIPWEKRGRGVLMASPTRRSKKPTCCSQMPTR